MDNLFVLKDVAPYAARVGSVTPGTTTIRDFTTGVLELAEGAVGFINEAGVTIMLATGGNTSNIDALVKDTHKFALILGTATATPIISEWIDREYAQAIMQAYCAPLKQESYIGSDGSNGLNMSTAITWANAVGHVLKFSVVRTDRDYPNIQPGDTWNFNYTIASTTAATELTALVAYINARVGIPFTASVVSTNKGIKLVNNDFGTTIKIIIPSETVMQAGIRYEVNELTKVGALQFGSGISVSGYFGCGTPAEIKAYEDLAYADKGRQDTYREAPYDEDPIWNKASQVSTDATCGYNQTNIIWNKNNSKSSYRKGETPTQRFCLAMPLLVNATTKVVTGYGSGLTLALQDNINLTFDVLLHEARTAAGTVESGEKTAGEGTA